MKYETLVFATIGVLLAGSPVLAQQTSDEPRPMNVRLAFQIIGTDGPGGDDPEIQAVVTELRKLFRFEGYHLLASSILNATGWPASSVKQLVGDDRGRRFLIEADVASNGPGIRLAVRLGESGGAPLIDAAVNLENGRTVVLGTASVRATGRSGLDDDVQNYRSFLNEWRRAAPREWDTYPGQRLPFEEYWKSESARQARYVLWSQGVLAGADNAAIILVVTPTINP
jgi:hypothetical protein